MTRCCAFCGAQARGAQVVLVITGKGARGGEQAGERGVLRREVPLWLRLPEFRSTSSASMPPPSATAARARSTSACAGRARSTGLMR